MSPGRRLPSLGGMAALLESRRDPADSVRCRFPGCGAELPLQHSDDQRQGLCFDHRQMAYYDPEGFVRLWHSRTPTRADERATHPRWLSRPATRG
jgi:hypothetical protein